MHNTNNLYVTIDKRVKLLKLNRLIEGVLFTFYIITSLHNSIITKESRS